MEAEQEVVDVSPGLDAMTLGSREDRVQHGRSRARSFMTQEEPIFAANGLMPERPFADIVIDGQTTIVGVPT